MLPSRLLDWREGYSQLGPSYNNPTNIDTPLFHAQPDVRFVVGVQSLPTPTGGEIKHIHQGSKLNGIDRVLTRTTTVAIQATGGKIHLGGGVGSTHPAMTLYFMMIKDGPLSDAEMLNRYTQLKEEFNVNV